MTNGNQTFKNFGDLSAFLRVQKMITYSEIYLLGEFQIIACDCQLFY